MTHFDLAILGSGSANSVITHDVDDRRIALVEPGDFGGTCLNRGCIPTKMFVYAAEVADTVRDARRFGVDASIDGVRWPDIRDRIFGRIDPVSAGGRDYRRLSSHVTLFEGTGAFVGPREISVDGGEPWTADQVVIGTGARPVLPAVVTESSAPYVTSDTIMRIDRLPESLVILGGGYVAVEFAHIFSALGVTVRLVTKGPVLLGAQDGEVARRFTDIAERQWEVHLSAEPTAVRGDEDGVALDLADGSVVAGDLLLVATGRTPNTESLNLSAAGVELRDDGRVRVDEFGRTTADGVWALGDVSSEYQLKHVANGDARIVAHNLLHATDLRPVGHRFVPSAVFTSPQIASVGATREQLEQAGRPFVSAHQAYGDTAFGWAMEDTESLCLLYADPDTGLLLGAHLMGPQSSTLIQPLIQAMAFDQPAHQVAQGQYWIHPALSEVVENALLKLPRPRSG